MPGATSSGVQLKEIRFNPSLPAAQPPAHSLFPPPVSTCFPERKEVKGKGRMNYILSNPKLFPFQPRLCRPSNDNGAFRRVPGWEGGRRERRGGGTRFPPGGDQKPGTPSHITPLSGREDPTSTTRRPSSWCWANAEALNGHPSPMPSTQGRRGLLLGRSMGRVLFPPSLQPGP